MKRRAGCGLAVLLALFALAFCCCGKGEARAAASPPRPIVAGGTPQPAVPANLPPVGDEIVMPPVLLSSDALVIAYKHGHPGYQDAYGFDTEVFRFRMNGDGTLREVAINKRLMEGESTVDGIDYSHAERTATVKSSFEGRGGSDCALRPEGGALVARGKDFVFSYSAPEPGVLRIEHEHGERNYVEVWRKAEGGRCIVTDTAGENAKGSFEGGWPRPRRYVERPDADPSGGSDTTFEFFDLDGGLKFRSDSAEPLGEGLVLNSAIAFPKGPDLEAIALLDITLGEERRITPLLARLYFGSE